MWVPPDRSGVDPGYEQADVGGALDAGGLVAVASGRGHAGGVSIHQRDAVLWVARLAPGQAVTAPGAPFVHVFVARGVVSLERAGSLDEGDAVRLTEEGPSELRAGDDGTEVLVWEMGSPS
jgi:hypothetical protein